MYKPAEKHAKNRYDYENGFYWKLFFCKSDILQKNEMVTTIASGYLFTTANILI